MDMNFTRLLKSRFTANLGGSFVFNIANTLFPLITIPYLIRTLGETSYGTVLFVQAVMTYVTGFTDLGLSLTGPKVLGRNIHNRENLRSIFWSIILIKVILFLVSAIVILTVHRYTPLLKYRLMFFAAGTASVFGRLLMVDWYFRGTNNLKVVSGLNLVSRTAFVTLIFIYVNSRAHIVRVLAIDAAVSIVVGALTIIYVMNSLGKGSPSFIWLRQEYKGLSCNFMTTMLNAFSRYGHLFVIRQFLPESSFALYAIAYKVVMSVYNVLSAFPQVVFSHMGTKVHDKLYFKTWLNRFLIFNTGLYTLCALCIIIAGYPLAAFFNIHGTNAKIFISILAPMSSFLVFSGVTTILSATFSVLTGREHLPLLSLLAAAIAFYIYISQVHTIGLLYAGSLPLVEGIWAACLLTVYLADRKKTS